MQTDTTASYPPVADVGPLHSALSSLVYSDLMAGVPLPPSFGEEFWSGGKYMEGIPTSITSSHLARTSPFPFGSPKSVVPSTFEGANCTYQGIPFDGSSRWGASDHELQESSIMNEWMWNEQERLRLNSINPGPSQFSNELSLSLATSHPPPCVVVHGATTIQEQGRGGSELSSSGVTSYSSFHKRHVGSDNMSCSSSSSKALPVSTLLSGPRFFQAMQQILAEVARFALEDHDHHHHRASFASSHAADLESDRRFNNVISCGKELESKKKNLISLLQMVDDQYNHCIDEIHTVISAFHAVTELDPNLHARFALPTVSAMYKSLRERISSHILAMGAQQSDGAPTREDSTFETSFIQQKWALQQLKKRDSQLWRPQRGLPERSVSVLRAWMFQNFLHPYPKDAEKQLLALKSGLTRSQVSNWFINARVRLWKPMIDEMYAEMNRRKALKNQEDGNNSHRNHLLFESRIF